ncbi:MAG TPA: alpha-L-arabinofuranosidase C-terminal domain-containing protein [Candidatus Omnitrophota bacterium]|nr:alpha-L-arabinofuranosidase C-terminal domain-containing protein [Candidatus Omnitrophota bacterium]
MMRISIPSTFIMIAAAVLFRPLCVPGNETALIRVHAQKEAGAVNNLVFGTNFIGYDPATYEDRHDDFRGYCDYGAGVWDPGHARPSSEAMELARAAGVSVIRFPGGCGAHRYDWKAAIGAGRTRFLFGIDEFLRTCRETGAVPVYTVSYFKGNESDAADLVEYLNGRDDGTNPNAGVDWAAVRSANGHPEPYGVSYFEIGNEDWHGDHRKVGSVSPESYGRRYLAYWSAMKSVDPSIQIGAILCDPLWDSRMMNIIRGKIDFGIMHMYPDAGENGKKIRLMPADMIFEKTLERVGPVYETLLKNTSKLLKEKAGRAVPLAVTEFNAGFIQEEPVPYRHSLGAALVNAELLRMLLQAGSKVIMANYWQFLNSYWGAAYETGDYMARDHAVPARYVKRPNYLVYELYRDHFGSELVEAEVLPVTSQLSVNASKTGDGNSIYLIVANKDMHMPMDCVIEFDDTAVMDDARAWILNAPSVDATNELISDAVRIEPRPLAGSEGLFRFRFEPHSLTAVEFIRKEL